MVQKELADRMVAHPGTKEMSSFTIFLQTYCKPSIALKVSRHCFFPAPNVDSCVVRLDFHPPRMKNPELFLAIVRRAFQQRRKMLRSTLSIQNEPFASMRPEALSFDDWMTLLIPFIKNNLHKDAVHFAEDQSLELAANSMSLQK